MFNRPDPTRQVFEAIRSARPEHLYIAADGPRADHPSDVERCTAVRSIVAGVDWPCEVRTLFRERNLGCREAVSEAIDWFFDAEPEGIVLEDDCLPAPGFFDFCAELLERYRHDDRIMLLSGYNARGVWPIEDEDYFFSNLGGIWGWASWRRAWRHFDLGMNLLDAALRRGTLRDLLGPTVGREREQQMLRSRSGEVSTWDYAWGLARNLNSGLAAVPTESLIVNIGFGPDATHTTAADGPPASWSSSRRGPFRENRIVVADRDYDERFHPMPTPAQRFRAAAGSWVRSGTARLRPGSSR